MSTAAFVVQLLVAFATVVLAGATFWLGMSTRRMAKETRAQALAVVDEVVAANRQVEVTRDAYQSAIMPWLVVTPNKPPDHLLRREVKMIVWPRETGGSFKVRNIGNGLAVVPEGGVNVVQEKETDDRLSFPGAATPPCIGVSEDAYISFKIPASSAQASAVTIDSFSGRTANTWGKFAVEVRFTDATGGQPIRATFRVFGEEDGRYRVHAVGYQGLEHDKPVIATVIGWPRDAHNSQATADRTEQAGEE